MNQPRSVFVDIVAWVFIVFTGFGVLIMLLETLMFFLLPFGEMMADAPRHLSAPVDPAVFIWIMRGFILVMLAVTVWGLAASIGLLLRRNWGRLNFIVLMVLGILFNFFGVIWSLLMVFAGTLLTPEMTARPEMPGMEWMQTFFYVFAGVMALLSIGFCVLFAWIIKKLLSPSIAAEFMPSPVSASLDA